MSKTPIAHLYAKNVKYIDTQGAQFLESVINHVKIPCYYLPTNKNHIDITHKYFNSTNKCNSTRNTFTHYFRQADRLIRLPNGLILKFQQSNLLIFELCLHLLI